MGRRRDESLVTPPTCGRAPTPRRRGAVRRRATADGSTGCVYRLQQRAGRLAVVASAQFSESSPHRALATTGPAGGRIVVAADKNLYVLRFADLLTAAKLSPTSLRKGCAPCSSGTTAPSSAQTGFYVTTPVVTGSEIYLARDDGAQLALDLATAQPLPAAAFTQDAGNAGSTFTRGQAAVADGHVVFGSVKGVFAYRLSTGPPPPPPPAGSESVFTPVADANVKSTSATRNYGTAATLRVRDGGTTADTYRSYLRFDVSGLTAPVSAVRLRLWVTDASPDSGRLLLTGGGWTEGGITWSNAPAPGATTLGTVGSTSATGAWVEVPLTGAVAGNGTVDLSSSTPARTAPSSTAARALTRRSSS